MSDVSDQFKVEFYGQETDQVFTALLTFSSDELSEDIRIASDPKETLPTANVLGVVSNSNEFLFAPFDIRLPRDDKTGVISAKLTIDNLDQTIIPHLRSVKKPIDLKIEVVLSANTDYIEKTYTGFKLDNIEYDQFTISGTLTKDYWDAEPFPYARLTPSGWPGLHA